eukprot:CAMPEP_0202968016 /NCGR_PEP_ID=MMETSP1396-20130829/13117_1 /ASSEMBLY_ACC=CAM_ASM_000872 /TAXON_ID= /ORGANISM="Pseudokeronopsis sp., Strain Brazil" /LENGTH=69 /DNA_ID=CAMNT_0049693791 /DNA_START=739 /DNA_END=948 /DNA_ORIENTATION=-
MLEKERLRSQVKDSSSHTSDFIHSMERARIRSIERVSKMEWRESKKNMQIESLMRMVGRSKEVEQARVE